MASRQNLLPLPSIVIGEVAVVLKTARIGAIDATVTSMTSTTRKVIKKTRRRRKRGGTGRGPGKMTVGIVAVVITTIAIATLRTDGATIEFKKTTVWPNQLKMMTSMRDTGRIDLTRLLRRDVLVAQLSG